MIKDNIPQKQKSKKEIAHVMHNLFLLKNITLA